MAMVNDAIARLESPFARSDYNRALEANLRKHADQFAKTKRKQTLAANMAKRTRPVHTKQAQKKASAKSSSTKQTKETVAASCAQSKESKETAAASSMKAKESKETATASSTHTEESKKTTAASSTQTKESKETATASSTHTEESKKTTAASSTQTKESKEAKHTDTTKMWDVCGFSLRLYKNWVSVRLDSGATRKFLFKEWNDEATAKKVAVEFAKAASKKKTMLSHGIKLKKEKIAYLKENGVDTLTGKETAADLEPVLDEACQSKETLLVYLGFDLNFRIGNT